MRDERTINCRGNGMSHGLIFMKFEDGDSIGFDAVALKSILSRNNCKIADNPDGSSFVEFPLNGESGTIGSEGSIQYHQELAESFNIDRPLYDESLYKLWFALMNELDVCCFTDYGGEIFATSDISQHVPEGLLEDCEKGVQIINTIEDLQ